MTSFVFRKEDLPRESHHSDCSEEVDRRHVGHRQAHRVEHDPHQTRNFESEQKSDEFRILLKNNSEFDLICQN